MVKKVEEGERGRDLINSEIEGKMGREILRKTSSNKKELKSNAIRFRSECTLSWAQTNIASMILKMEVQVMRNGPTK